MGDHLVEAQGISPVQHDVDDTQGLPSEGVGIGRSRGDDAHGEEACDGVHLVREADNGADVCGR